MAGLKDRKGRSVLKSIAAGAGGAKPEKYGSDPLPSTAIPEREKKLAPVELEVEGSAQANKDLREENDKRRKMAEHMQRQQQMLDY